VGTEDRNRKVLSRWRKINSYCADVKSSGRTFQIWGPAPGKTRLPTVESLTDGTTKRLVPDNVVGCRILPRDPINMGWPAEAATGSTGDPTWKRNAMFYLQRHALKPVVKRCALHPASMDGITVTEVRNLDGLKHKWESYDWFVLAVCTPFLLARLKSLGMGV
jgi:hypothetical protein